MDLPLLQNTQSSVSTTCPRLGRHVRDLLWQQHPVGALCPGGNFSACSRKGSALGTLSCLGVFSSAHPVTRGLQRGGMRFNVLWKALSTGERGGSAAKSLRSRLVSTILPLQDLFFFFFPLFSRLTQGCRACEAGVLPGNWRWATCAGKQGKRREREWIRPSLHCSFKTEAGNLLVKLFCISFPTQVTPLSLYLQAGCTQLMNRCDKGGWASGNHKNLGFPE